MRPSGILLWQIAYAELVFLPDLWPDMTPKKFQDVIEAYRHRFPPLRKSVHVVTMLVTRRTTLDAAVIGGERQRLDYTRCAHPRP